MAMVLQIKSRFEAEGSAVDVQQKGQFLIQIYGGGDENTHRKGGIHGDRDILCSESGFGVVGAGGDYVGGDLEPLDAAVFVDS